MKTTFSVTFEYRARAPFRMLSDGQHSIEDVAEDMMRVPQPQRSRRFQEMSDAAEAYFRALENTSDGDAEGILALRERLDGLRH